MSNQDAAKVRRRSLGRAREVGFPEPPVHLPALWEPVPDYRMQPVNTLVERTAVLTMAVQRYFGMPGHLAKTWIDENDLRGSLAPKERSLLTDEVSGEFSSQTESLWALAWLLRLHDDLAPSRYCGDNLASLLPDLRKAERLSEWLRRRTSPAAT